MIAIGPAADGWSIAAGLLALALVPCALMALRGTVAARLVALEMAGIIEALLLIALAESSHSGWLIDLGLALALLSFGGGLVFARFLERSV